MSHQIESDDSRRDCEVVHLEVGVVLADARGGGGDRVRFGPGTTGGESGCDGFGDLVDEGAERWLRLDGGGDWEDWW